VYARRAIGSGRLVPSIRRVVEAMPRTRVITQTDRYLHAEVRSKIFRFVDDLEIVVMPDRELVIRSASRVGRNDMGVNAERVEELRRLLGAADILR
jgi:uncharacterized protein (DUF1499 family)